MTEESSANAILLLSCQDQKGLVYNISNFIYRHNGNIVHAAQHTSVSYTHLTLPTTERV